MEWACNTRIHIILSKTLGIRALFLKEAPKEEMILLLRQFLRCLLFEIRPSGDRQRCFGWFCRWDASVKYLFISFSHEMDSTFSFTRGA
jgi:hypothetical protein